MVETLPPVETTRRLTEDESMALPDDGRKYELVGGEAIAVPTGSRHGRIGAWLSHLQISHVLPGFRARVADLFGSAPHPASRAS